MSLLTRRRAATAFRRQVNLGVGGLLSVQIGADGWFVDLTFRGQTLGGTYDFGLGSGRNPDTGNPKLKLLVTSLGFDDTGAATTITRTVIGTFSVRKPYPDHASKQESTAGQDVIVRVALDEYIYGKDQAGAGNSGTDVAVTALPGLYTVGGVASTGGTLTATNSSTVAYPKVVGNWSWPGFEKTGATITPRLVAFHRHARLGRPVRTVRFTATGVTSLAAVTQTVTATTVNGTLGDAVPVPEYEGALSSATLTQGENVTLRAQVFPWVGDADSVLDTDAGTAQVTPLYGPIKVVCDKTGAYNTKFVVVDTAGNNATGVVGDGTPVGTELPFATIFAAYNALRAASDTAYARNNAGGGRIYLRTGTHTWTGGTITQGTTPDAWTEITRHPADARAGVIIGGTAVVGTKYVSLRQLIRDVTITAEIAAGLITPATQFAGWFDACTINIPTASRPLVAVTGSAGVIYGTRCTVTAFSQGFRPFSTNNMPWGIVRGNEIASVGGAAYPFVYIGNRKISTTTSGSLLNDVIASTTAPLPDNVVIAYNRQTVAIVGNALAQLGQTNTLTHGMALVQNIFENTSTSVTPLLQVTADGTVNTPVSNVMVWHNVAVGQRCNFGYNEVAPAAPAGNSFDAALVAHRRLWSVKNNVCDDMNTKHDVFEGSGFAANGGKVGGWPVLYGVGHSGNLFAETAGIGAPGTFVHEFPGLKSSQGDDVIMRGAAGGVSTGSRPITYILFVARASFDGTTAGAGNGDYRLQAGSPAKGLARDWLLSHDVAGTVRSAATDAGAYA